MRIFFPFFFLNLGFFLFFPLLDISLSKKPPDFLSLLVLIFFFLGGSGSTHLPTFFCFPVFLKRSCLLVFACVDFFLSRGFWINTPANFLLFSCLFEAILSY